MWLNTFFIFMVWMGFMISCLRRPYSGNIFQKFVNVVKCILFAPLIVGIRMSKRALAPDL
jgi:hypothetical protein